MKYVVTLLVDTEQESYGFSSISTAGNFAEDMQDSGAEFISLVPDTDANVIPFIQGE